MSVRRRLGRLARLAISVTAGQAAAILLQGVAGLLLIHWLSVTEYAEYTFAFSFSSTLTQLTDLGWGDAMLAVIGEDSKDPAIVGSVLRAALSLRWVFFGIVTPLSAIGFVLLAEHHPWPAGVDIALFSSIVITLTARTYGDYYTIPLILAKRFGAVYSATIAASLGRIGCNAILKVVNGLTGATAALLNGVSIAASSLGIWLFARSAVRMPSKVSKEHRAAILRVALPTLPAQIFFAFQGQIAFFVITVTGTDASLASLGALSRLGPMFQIITTVIAYVFVPRVASAADARVMREIVWCIAAVTVVVMVVTALGFLYPVAFLFVLGHRYEHLGPACSWFICASALGVIAICLNALAVARRYTWWWASSLQIGGIILAEIGGALIFRLNNLLQLQYWTIAWEVPWLAVQAGALIYGRRRDAAARRGVGK